MNSFNWKKPIFSSTYSIYSNNHIIGELKSKLFSQTCYGELNGKKYTFKTKGFFNQSTEIVDLKTNKVIGEINYSNWMTKATITLNEKSIYWKYDNAWNTKWSIFDNEYVHIKYSGKSTRGLIESYIDDELLLLSGLFVTNYYWQVSIAIMVAVFIPIYTSILR